MYSFSLFVGRILCNCYSLSLLSILIAHSPCHCTFILTYTAPTPECLELGSIFILSVHLPFYAIK